MCGINAIFAWHPSAPPADADELIRTREAMRARGPDAAGSWISPDHRVALGHRRLAVIDVRERANQPMLHGRSAIILNGEIYNHDELRAASGERGDERGELPPAPGPPLAARPSPLASAAPFITSSDTEVLLRLVLREGPDVLPRLRGMFAFALWNGDTRTLLMARDPYGIKPLYLADDGRTFRLASQVRALLVGGGVSATRDPAGLAGFLLRGSVPEPFTLYKSIRALPAGHWMMVTESGPSEPRPFFSVARVWFDAAQGRRHLSTAEKQAEIAAAVRDSVRAHLVSDVPLGAFLSAGRDSGTVVALARETGTPLQTVTLRFDEHEGTRHDEAPVAALVARQYGTEHTTVTLTAGEFRDELQRILAAMDQPSVDALNSWFVCAAAARLGWKVALSGTGGDELFGGYSTFRTIPRTVRTFGVFRHLPRLAGAYGRLHRALVPRTPRFSPKSAALPLYGGSYEGAYLVRRGLFLPEELPAILGDETAREALRRLDLLQRIRTVITPDPGHPFARVAALESELFLRNQLLRDLDWCSMAHGLEARVPLVDPVLLQCLAPLVLDGGGKDLLARAPRQPLPPEVLQRPKTGFTIPAKQWLDDRPARVRIHPFGRRNWALYLLDAL